MYMWQTAPNWQFRQKKMASFLTEKGPTNYVVKIPKPLAVGYAILCRFLGIPSFFYLMALIYFGKDEIDIFLVFK